MPPGTLRAARGLPSGIIVRGLLAVAFLGCDAFLPLALTELRGFSVVAGRARDQRGVAELEPRLVPAGAPGPARRRRRARRGGCWPGSPCCSPGSRRRRSGVIADGIPVAVAIAGWIGRGARDRHRLPLDRRARALGQAPARRGGQRLGRAAADRDDRRRGLHGHRRRAHRARARRGLGRGDGAGAGVRGRRRRGGGGAGGGAAGGAGR